MDLISMRTRLFRTIGQTEIELPLDRYLTIVGPNNSGKTNLLRAVQMFFTGPDNELAYSRRRDFTFSGGTGKTSLLATFKLDTEADADVAIVEGLERLYQLYGLARPTDTFSLSLVFSPSDVPTYQFLPNTKKPLDNAVQTQISRTQKQLVTELLAKFSCHYVPSEKSVRQLYDEVLNPFLKRTAADALRPQMTALRDALDAVSKRINAELAQAGLGALETSFAIPNGDLEFLLDSFEFRMKDPVDTELNYKGQGIQSTAFFAALRWVSEEERSRGLKSIWLLEEPEAYLHPELMPTVQGLLRRVSEISSVVVSTHSLAFVPADPHNLVGTQLRAGVTEAMRFTTYTQATDSIRAALGVRFSDYYSLDEYNLALEGQSDRELLQWYLGITPPQEHPLPRLRRAHLLDFGGVKFLAGWLRATYQYIRLERALVAVFDGDLAGEKERKDLTQFFGGHNIPFQANHHYVIVRSGYPIESLFPDSWLTDLNDEQPAWFDDFAVDSAGALASFKMSDANKTKVQRALIERAERAEDEPGWRARWDVFAEALETALEREEKRIAKLAQPPSIAAPEATGN